MNVNRLYVGSFLGRVRGFTWQVFVKRRYKLYHPKSRYRVTFYVWYLSRVYKITLYTQAKSVVGGRERGNMTSTMKEFLQIHVGHFCCFLLGIR